MAVLWNLCWKARRGMTCSYKMRLNSWLLPSLTLLAVGGWIVSQKRSAATLERDITVLTSRIRQARAMEDSGLKSRDAEEKARKEKERKIDWKDIAGKISQGNQDMIPDMRTMMRMQRLLMDLSGEELKAQLDEIDALDLADDTRKRLREMILGALTEKDPKLALDLFGKDHDEDDFGVSWQMGNALKKWAEKDPAAAAAWLERQIAEGKLESKSLDGKNRALVRYESALVEVLLKSDPAAATARVKALPEDQREEVLEQGAFHDLAKKDEAAYATLVRDSLPEEKVGDILANTALFLAMKDGYERVDSFLTNTNASVAEKEAIVTEAMNGNLRQRGGTKLSEEEYDKARAWAAGHAPAVVDKVTGESLANSLRRDEDFDSVSKLVLKYNESAGNDDVLATFLKNQHMRDGNTDEAIALIEKIKDPTLREEIRNLPHYRKQTDEP
jgi:hypothetical protein